MRKRIGLIAAVSAIAILGTSCSMIAGGDDLSAECREAINTAGNDFVAFVETTAADIDAGGSPTAPSTLPFEGSVNAAQRECSSSDEGRAISELIIALKAKSDRLSGDTAKYIAYSAIGGVCATAEQGMFTPDAQSICSEVDDLADEYRGKLLESELPAPDGGSSSNGNGFAIGDVDTSLEFPDSGDDGDSSYLGSDRVAPYEVTYVVDGVGTAFISYVDSNDESKYEEVILPWQYSGTFEFDWTDVSATGDQSGEISCAIYHDGVEVEKKSTSGSSPFVNCYTLR